MQPLRRAVALAGQRALAAHAKQHQQQQQAGTSLLDLCSAAAAVHVLRAAPWAPVQLLERLSSHRAASTSSCAAEQQHDHHHHEHGSGCCHESSSGHQHQHRDQQQYDAQQQQQRAGGGGEARPAAAAAAKRTPLSFEEQESACWSCHDRHQRGGLVCRSCERIQPVDSTLNHFEVMGYHQPTFDLDPAALEKRYKLLQWQLHPDKSAGKTAEERQYSADQATLVNQAYGVLRSPLARANYMLMLSGLPDDRAERTIADPDLLMEVMEARELVDQEDDQERLVKLHSANKRRQAALCEQLSAAFRAGDVTAAEELAAQLSYWVRLEEAICDKL